MKIKINPAGVLCFLLLFNLNLRAQQISSPGGNLSLNIDTTGSSILYSLNYKGKIIILPSRMGVEADGFSLIDSFQFIKDVAVDWDNSWYLEAEPGDYITVARKAKGKEEWFVGGITDENPQSYNIRKTTINSRTILKIQLAASGGAAISVR